MTGRLNARFQEQEFGADSRIERPCLFSLAPTRGFGH